jgi:uncharacterized protein
MRLALPLIAMMLPLLAADYAREVADFRAAREQSIRAEDGWASVVGLAWLKPGLNRIGSDEQAEVVLPASAPARVGTLILQDGHVNFRPSPGVKIPTQELKDEGPPLTLGSVKFFMIKRSDKFGIRVKDSEAPTRKQFTHLSWYPVDASWRVEARFTPWDKPHTLTFDTVVEGLKEEDPSPGFVTFTKDGHEFRLEPVIDDNELFFIFRDQTSGKSTYAASRFLYAEMPKNLKAASTVVLDFNKAINPPCVFTAYATCPLPPPQNRLSLAVTAGELMYNNHR